MVKNNKLFPGLIMVVIMLSACKASISSTPTFTVVPITPMVEIPTELPLVMSTATSPATETLTPAPPTETPFPTVDETGPVRAIILFIGDGMGTNQRLGAQWLIYGQEGALAMDSMPVRGSAQTASANSPVTDSAASGTAMATGVKTNNRIIGMDAEYNLVENILEQAQAQGWAVGVVTTVQMANATPAAFAAHVRDRDYLTEIAQQIMEHDIDVLLGGGEDDFLPTSVEGCYPSKGNRGDGLNLIEEAVVDEYIYVCTAEELLAVETNSTSKLIGFFGDEEIGQPNSPTLTDLTRVAIENLSQDPDGFFLLVEGGQIDWEGHDNDAAEIMQLTLGLDLAVIEAQLYAVGEPNTLIIVAADHETGGMRLNLDCKGSFREDGPFVMPDGTQFCVDWWTTSHTAEDVLVTAQGPYSDLLAGEYPNTWIYQVMFIALGEPEG